MKVVMDQWLDLIEVFPNLNDSEMEEEGKKEGKEEKNPQITFVWCGEGNKREKFKAYFFFSLPTQKRQKKNFTDSVTPSFNSCKPSGQTAP